MANTNRPLSPHLQVYRPQLTSMLSILHRGTGVALAGGLILMLWWLVALASGPEYYDYVMGIAGSIIGRLVMLGFTWALFFHLCNGLRHLYWDAGWGFEIASVYRSGYMVVIGATVLTVLAWIAAYGWGG
ncbi:MULTISPECIES: succinate dehydrogenase, cytochrome b556 subunit [unclassified Minwuia]|jgi:succinate dehydrogenase cytochrome b subunit|uniref:succinate dehydrogenase, cytochrome b556 subunit n=1 Tax=unclassified Minwuia TaxID=2618799 RepID=UPI00208D5E0D|nr:MULTISPECIES: succinate dehydrogenase, cytochrome b556 subunit [unclassified Minwuia]MDF1731913.1 succinate dehydrogenase, cytochrome b556 subunit [Minwuia sp.]GJL88627.1 MAG: succinate dehydrogenase, cytochrome b556 subunit [Minwuia thermotolerans]|tara:strand:+ start:127 stop:516 length:390 start_codon:yes stop_codon:yes gene_type:complete